MTIKLLDKVIADLNSLLEIVKEDWNTPIVEADKIWFAQLVNKTRALKNEYQNQRSKLVGQASQEQLGS